VFGVISAAATRSPSLCPHSGSSPLLLLRCRPRRRRMGRRAGGGATTADREESWRRSALTTHHLCPSVGERNHHHGAIDLPAACSEFRRQLLREKRIEWRLDASCSGRWGGLSSSVRSASSPCVRKREGGEKALQREPQLGGDLELRQLRRGCVGA
jgi:hypothetical protein